MVHDNTYARMAVDYLGAIAGVKLSPLQRQAALDTLASLPAAPTLGNFLEAVNADTAKRAALAPLVAGLESAPDRYAICLRKT